MNTVSSYKTQDSLLSKALSKHLSTGKYRRQNKLCRCLLLVALSSVTACSSLSKDNAGGSADRVSSEGASESQNSIDAKERIIAINLVNVLVQVDGYHPSSTSLVMKKPKSSFGQALKQVVEEVGYEVSYGGASAAPYYLDYNVSQGAQEETGFHQTYLLSVGNVKLKRDYFLQPQGVTPSSNVFMLGTDPSLIILSDSVFDENPPNSIEIAQVAQDTLPPKKIEKSTSDKALLVNSDDSVSAVPLETSVVNEKSVVPKISMAEKLSKVRERENTEKRVNKNNNSESDIILSGKNNMYTQKKSNFSDVFNEYIDIDQHIVLFPNDSLRLGSSAKKGITSLLKSYNSKTDIISVVGCSHGRTTIEDGNRVLATGRANRVKEALLYAGVDKDKILDEGCWAPKHFDEVFPRRGVVMTIKREKAAS